MLSVIILSAIMMGVLISINTVCVSKGEREKGVEKEKGKRKEGRRKEKVREREREKKVRMRERK
jgi:hypothetical protein